MDVFSRLRVGRRAVASITTGLLIAATGLVVGPASPAHAVVCTKTWGLTTSSAWNTAGNWTPVGVPSASDDVCISGATTYTVSVTDTTAVAKSITVGGTAGNQTLAIAANCSFHAALSLSNSSTITSRGRLTLDSTACSNNATVSAPAGQKLINAGIITAAATSGGARTLAIDIQQNAGSALNVNLPTSSAGTFTFTNAGSINIATGAVLNWQGGSFSNNGGTIAGVGNLQMTGGTYTQGLGTTTGTPPLLTDTNIVYAGIGASTLIARGTNSGTLTGNIAAGQTLDLFADCSFHSQRTATASFTNAGTINLDSSACSNNATLAGGAGILVTNTGTINSNATSGGVRLLAIDMTNSGTVNVNQSANSAGVHTFLNQSALNIASTMVLDWQNGDFTNGTGGSINGVGTLAMEGSPLGTYHQGTGTVTGTPPLLTDTNIAYSGAGASTLIARGTNGGTLTGNIATGQTLDLFADCSFHSQRNVTASFTNAGTINFDSPACSNNASLVTTTAVPVLTNTGTINSNATSSGARNLTISVVNQGVINVHSTLDAVSSRTFNQNGGTITIDVNKQLNWRNGAFTNTAGTINGTGGKVTGGGLFTQVNGTIVGASVQRFGSIAYTGTGLGRIDVAGTGGNLTGTMIAGQSLNLIATCSSHVARNLTANFTNGGVITLKSGGCNDNASITSSNPAIILTNGATGTINADATQSGARTLSTSITNNGTININQAADSVGNFTFINQKNLNVAATKTLNWRGGTFTNGTGGVVTATGSGALVLGAGSTYHAQNGTALGTAPVISDNGNIDFNATGAVGATTIIANGTGGNLTGASRSGQSLNLQANCAEHAQRTTAAAFTNNGTIVLSSTGGCNNNATLNAGAGTFTNAGTVTADDAQSGQRNIIGNVVNNKTVTIGAITLSLSAGNLTSTSPASVINVRVASASAFGRITSTGFFTLGGTLNIATDAGFWPATNQDYLLMNGAAARVGTFTTVNGLTRVAQPVVYTVQYQANGLNLHTT